MMPNFAVVGRVNKGKSSVIASLIEDDAVKISPRPGTTTECVRYDVEVDGQALFSVTDTPGFEDAPRALHWIRARETTAADRVQRVKEFVNAHDDTDEFVEECRLLRPILDGAAILYVVNGDEPYRKNFETEMEILRYTGRPAMALINRSAEGRYVEDWTRALNQYFKLVREFDAHAVTWVERRKLLEAFQTLEPGWESALQTAIDALQAEEERRRYQVATIVTDMITDCLTLHLGAVLADEAALEHEKSRLEREFHDKLREREAKAHRRIGEVYLHRLDGWSPETDVDLKTNEDLFAKETWDVMGLSPKALLTLTTLTGAAAGGAVDAAVGLASFFTGTVLGGIGGFGVGVYELSKRFASASNLGQQAMDILRPPEDGGHRVRVGPHPSLNFPFVLLARAVDHFDRVVTWAHARKELPPASPTSPRFVDELDLQARRKLTKAFSTIRKKYKDVPRDTKADLRQLVQATLLGHKSRPS